MKINRRTLSRSRKYQPAVARDIFLRGRYENKLFSNEIVNTTLLAEIGSFNLETLIATNDYIQEKVLFKRLIYPLNYPYYLGVFLDL
jgi:hypothetical protein